MKPTFHIIEEIYIQEFKDFFVGIDNHRNYIHIPKSLLKNKQLNPKAQWFELKDAFGEKLLYEGGEIRKGIKIEGLEFPFYVLAETKKFQNADKIKLFAFSISHKFSHCMDAFIKKHKLSSDPNIPNDDNEYHRNFVNKAISENESYNRNKTAYKELSLLRGLENSYSDDRIQALEELHLIFNFKIHPWIVLLREKFNCFTLELDLSIDDYLGMICDWSCSFPYAISITTVPLFKDIDRGYNSNKHKGASRAKERIMTLDKFKELDKTLDYQYYLHQFYYLNAPSILNKKKAEEEFNWRNYVIEGSLEHHRRVYEIFKTPYAVQITPYWNPDIDKILLTNLHNQIEKVATILIESGIKNLIISPPFNVINYKIEEARLIEKSESDYYGKLEENFMDEFNNQGLGEIDDQDEGWWRIANDID
jgi:hypothetical protein